MKLVLDTNRYSDFWSGDPLAVSVITSADAIFLPFVVLAELRGGFRFGTRERDNERSLQTFFAKETVSILWADDATTMAYATIYTQLRRQSTPIPTNDIWIASLALQHGLTLYARDSHFDYLPQLMRI